MNSQGAKIFVISGLAGSGKTSFIAKTRDILHDLGKKVYVVNLDPAIVNMYYPVNLDIRDTVNFTAICHSQNIGPNGAILACLNLFFSKIDQFMGIIQRKVTTHDYILIDTPGQIEFLLWSASGDVLCNNLLKIQPSTTLCYVVDMSKCNRGHSSFFPSNILLFSGIHERTRPVNHLIVFNKSDLIDRAKTQELQGDDDSKARGLKGGMPPSSFRSELDKEILDSFGKTFSEQKRHYVSSVTGDGIRDVFV